MGLDMYLTSRIYVAGQYEHRNVKGSIDITIGEKKLSVPVTRVAEIICSEAYWRKANMIHQWFVQNVQGGKDKCQESYVSHEQLVALRDLCREVLDSMELKDGMVVNGFTCGPDGISVPNLVEGKTVKDPGKAKDLLPITDGFFFGNTEYDEYYYEDVKYTLETLDAIIARPDFDKLDFYYRASW